MRTGIHPTAVVGDPPEWRDWAEGDELRPPEVDPSARLNAFVTVDAGLERPTHVGARCFLMAHVHVGHDAYLSADCQLAPGTVIGGYVEVGRGAKFGVNSCVKPLVKVGARAVVGAGAVVVRDVPAGEVWAGNPARAIGAPMWTPGEDEEEAESGYDMNGQPLSRGEARRLGLLT